MTSHNTARAEEHSSPLAEIYGQYPFEIEKGEDVFVYGTDGKKYLDFYGGHCVCCVGHSRKEVVDAISKQAGKLMFYSNLARIPIREQAAQKLLDFARNDFKKVFFCNSGGEANENALKIAIKVTGRHKIASFKGGFHGRTLLAIGATDHPDWHEYLGPWIGPTTQLRVNEKADLKLIDKQTAAVILEPIQSIGGCTVFDFEYLKQLKAACDETGAMLIFDEVQTGIGRTGTPFVSGHCGVLPDMMTLAKGLANGFAIGAVVMTAGVARELKIGDIAATFGGGPMAMAALIATLDYIEKEKLTSHVKEIESYVREKFKIPGVTEIRGKGALLGLVLEKDARPVQHALFPKGIICGLNSNPKLLHLLPPMTIQKQHVDELFNAFKEIS